MSKKTLDIVKETNNDAVIQLKSNQKFLYKLVKTVLNDKKPLATFTQKAKKGHGRIELRKTEVFEIPEISKKSDVGSEWSSISCVVRTSRTRKVFNTKKKKYEKPETSISYHVSTKIFKAKTFAKIIQKHWGIENKVNYVKDVQFKEDYSRIRNNPGIFSRLRAMALNILRMNNVQNISRARFLNCLNVNNVLNYKSIA